jgi:uncharacterized protein YggE
MDLGRHMPGDAGREEEAMKRTGWIALVLVVGLVVGFGANALAGDGGSGPASAPTPPRTITVTSTASVGTAPDEAVLEFGMRSEGADSGAAYDANGTKSDAVLAALLDAGLTKDDVETQSQNVDRQTKDRGTPSERTVYVASTQISVTVHDLKAVSSVIAAAVNAGADSVHGLRFQVGDQTSARQDALAAAVRGAKRKADAIAAAAGTSVSGVVQVREESSNSRPYYYRGEALASFAVPAAAPAIVAPQTVSTQVTVTVIWAIA